MPDARVEILAVLAAAVAAFAIGGTYYSVFGEQLAAASEAAAAGEQPPPWVMAAEIGRCLVLALEARGDPRRRLAAEAARRRRALVSVWR